MTLVIGLTAAEGAVLVADGQATGGTGELLTRTTGQKLGVLHGGVIYGMAGDAGLYQRVVAELERKVPPDLCLAAIDELRPFLRKIMCLIQKEAYAEYTPARGAPEPAIEALFAGIDQELGPWLLEVSRTGMDQLYLDAEAIGAQSHYASYAVMSAAHYRLPERPLEFVCLFGYRAVDDAIRTDATSLSHPIHMLVIDDEGPRWVSRNQLDDDMPWSLQRWQIQEGEVVDALERSLRPQQLAPEGPPIGIDLDELELPAPLDDREPPDEPSAHDNLEHPAEPDDGD